MTGVYTELENVYAGKSASPLRGGSPAEPEVGGQTEAYGRCLSPLTLPPLTGTHMPAGKLLEAVKGAGLVTWCHVGVRSSYL